MFYQHYQIVADSTEKTKYFFDDVHIRELNGEYVLSGLLIKDTVLEVRSEYTESEGLKKTNKRFKSSPYSLFLIYLKNHRMMLVKIRMEVLTQGHFHLHFEQ